MIAWIYFSKEEIFHKPGKFQQKAKLTEAYIKYHASRESKKYFYHSAVRRELMGGKLLTTTLTKIISSLSQII